MRREDPFNLFTNYCLLAHDTVDAYKAQSTGRVILNEIEGETVVESTSRRSQVITLDTKSIVEIKDIAVQIDPQLLFQTSTLSAKAAGNIEDVFKYEL